VADGISLVTDKVFPDRFLHAAELVRMGARIRREGPSAVISGVERLSGACVMASDLRASAALIVAALVADGPSVVRRIYHLDRGYERLEDKLRRLGADVTRCEDTPGNMPAALVPAIVSGSESPVHAGGAPLAGPKWLTRRRAGAGGFQSAGAAGRPGMGDE
jgi:UDP-N-acetylglucosamine 1-carboxyvinyltransferase